MFKRVIEKGKLNIDGADKTILAHKGEVSEESISDHLKKTKKVFAFILEKDGILDNLYLEIEKEYGLEYNLHDFKKILLKMVEFHDIGKINPKFQKERIKNKEFENFDIKYQSTITHKHSLISALLFAIYLVREEEVEQNPILMLLPHIIHGHHTRLRSLFEENTNAGIASITEGEKYSNLVPTISYIFQISSFKKEEMEKYLNDVIQIYNSKFFSTLKHNSSLLSFFYNYTYSLLVKADYIASSYYDLGLEEMANNITKYYRRIDSKTLSKMKNDFQDKHYNYLEKIDENPLNKHRMDMYDEAIESLEEGLQKDKSVFYLQMPTGGGKTHTSLGLALKILNKTQANRLIYSLPYISLLEQNYDYFKQVLKLPSEYMRAIYSFSDIPEKGEEKILTYDDFFEYPVICTTNVSLIESIVKFNKSSKYRFGSLTNSIIILDEVQTLPVEYWPEFNYLLNETAKKLNSYILIMSATVPNLEKLKTSRKMDIKYDEVCHYLITNPEKYYEKFERNKIVSNDIKELKIDDTDQTNPLVEYILDKSREEFSRGHNHGLIVVNTVRTSEKLFDELGGKFEYENEDIEFMLLNSTILSSRKRRIVDKINDMDEYKKIILVSTQSVEAGLDVSFDFVVRDFSTLESIEQVRGRCNRNREIDEGNVYLMEIKNEKSQASKVYPDWRLKETRKILDKTNHSYSLRDINSYFENTIKTINEEISDKIGLTAAENIECWNKMKYEENDSPRNKHKKVFHVDVIEENRNNYTFFIGTSLDKDNFEEKEINFLEKKLSYQITDSVDGGDIIGLYQKMIIESAQDFVQKKILRKRLSSIISKFTVSAIVSIDEKELKSILDKIGPYFFIPDYFIGDEKHHIYSLDKGFYKDYFKENNNII